MRNFGLSAVLLVAVACAVQNNPLPDPEDTDSGGSMNDIGTNGGKAAGGSSGNKAGATTGGKPSAGSGGTLENMGGDEGSGGGGGSAGSGGKGGGGGKTSGGSGGSGGKASGGSGGSAGSGGKAGNGGSGGSTGGSGGAGCMQSPSGPIGGLSARYQNETPGVTGTGIGAQLALYNTGQSTLNLADLKLRYYLTNEVQANLNRTINWAWYRPIAGGAQDDKKAKVSFSVVSMTCKTANADSYLEFVFAADAGSLEPAHYLLFSWAANNASSQNFTQSNDYSFDTTSKVDADDNKIVVLQASGTRVWGTEP